MSEATIRIAAQMYKSRDAAKALLGDRYETTVREHMEFVLRKQQITGKSELESVMQLIKELRAVNSNGVTELILIAAVCEMIEGIFALPKPGTVIKFRSTRDHLPEKVAEGKCVVREHITDEGKPQHLRCGCRQLLVRSIDGTGTAQVFLISEKEIVK